MTGRKKGAQPGNKNAVNHGFYAGGIKPHEIEDLEAYAKQAHGLADEINLMRVLIRRVFEYANTAESGEDGPTQLEVWSTALNALGAASTRLAGLLRAQRDLTAGSSNEILDALSAALREVNSDYKLE